MPRGTPYSQFNFVVTFEGTASAFGGFSDVSGLDASTDPVTYREGTHPPKPVRKNPALVKFADVTLKRGIVNPGQLSAWLKSGASTARKARRSVTITLRDEKGRPTARWTLHQGFPVKYTGPALNAKGNDVAMEELVLSHEGITPG